MNFIHLELTSRCNKGDGTPGSGCFMCGRRKMERTYPDLCDWGDMPFEMVEQIAAQVSPDTLIQFFDNGESLLYPRLGDALRLFPDQIKQLNTNGKLLMEKADEIIDNLDVLTISVIQDDPEGDAQFEVAKAFLRKKRGALPAVVTRFLGKVDEERWNNHVGLSARRVLHSPDGSRDYEKPVIIPEHGVCLDLLNHLAIDRYGNVSLCVRFDPKGDLRLGNIKHEPLNYFWRCQKREFYIDTHIKQRRDELPGCRDCHYYGCPVGG